MKHKFYLFSLLLFSSISLQATVYNGTCGTNLTWTVNTGTGTLTISGSGNMYNYENSSAPWFSYRESITSVSIGNSVTSIGEYAFCGCDGFTSITIPNSVTSIGSCAFYSCRGLTNVTIPSSITSLGSSVFIYSYNISSIVVEANNTKYDSRSNCNAIIESATNKLIVGCRSTVIPHSVTSIGECAFSNCTRLTSINIPDNVTSIGNNAFFGCDNLESVNIGYRVKSIGDWAFTSCGFSSITIPSSVTSIGERAFSNTKLTSITIPSSVTSIGSWVFANCNYLRSASISYGITAISSNAFYECSKLSSVSLPYGLTNIGVGAFWKCSSLTSINIPGTVTNIGGSAFYGCSGLASITIPNSVTEIGGAAFFDCTGLAFVICYATTPPTIGNNVFYGMNSTTPLYVRSASLTTYSSTSSWSETFINILAVTSFGSCGDNLNWVLGSNGILIISGKGVMDSYDGYEDEYSPWSGYNNDITSVVISEGVTSIGQEAFAGCSGLTSVTIPSSLANVGSWAFSNCSGLTAVHISNLTAWCNIEFINEYSNPLYNAHHLFLSGSEITSLVIPNGKTTIRDYSFIGCTGLSSVTIPSSITSIGRYAFSFCSGLTSLTFPNSVINIEYSAFNACTGLISVIIPNSVSSIGYYAFEGCNNLTAVHITDLASWCNIAFSDNSANPLNYAHHLYLNSSEITQLTIPESVTAISSFSFSGCTGLTSITIHDNVTSIGNSTFYGCTGLTSIIIPNSVTIVGKDAFSYCSNLSSVTCYSSTPPSSNYYSYSSYSVFYKISNEAVLYVLSEGISAYTANARWNVFADIRPISKTATIGATGWTTFSCEAPLDLSGMTASTGTPEAYYAYNAAGSTVNLRSTTATVPAGEGLMLKGDNGATITIPVASSGTSIEGNKLVGCPSGATITSATPNYANIYVLANNNGTAQFENVKNYVDAHSSLSIGAGKAYLNLAGISLAPDALRFELEENNATQLEALAENENVVKFFQNGQLYILRDGITYDTMGRIVR